MSEKHLLNEEYPIAIKLETHIFRSVLMIIGGLLFLLPLLLPSAGLVEIIVGLIALLCIVLGMMNLITKGNKLNISNSGIEYINLFNKKRYITWDEFSECNVSGFGANKLLFIYYIKTDDVKSKKRLIMIQRQFIKEKSLDRAYSMIERARTKFSDSNEVQTKREETVYDENSIERNLLKTYSISLAITLGFILLDAVVMKLLNTSILILPFIGLVLNRFFFHKKLRRSDFNNFTKIWGITSAIFAVVLGRIIQGIMSYGEPVTPRNIISYSIYYFSHFKAQFSSNEIIWIGFALACLFSGWKLYTIPVYDGENKG